MHIYIHTYVQNQNRIYYNITSCSLCSLKIIQKIFALKDFTLASMTYAKINKTV